MIAVFDIHNAFNYLVLVNMQFQISKKKHDINSKRHAGRRRHDFTVSCDGSGCVTEPLVTASKQKNGVHGKKHLLEAGVSWRLCGQTHIPRIRDPRV